VGGGGWGGGGGGGRDIGEGELEEAIYHGKKSPIATRRSNVASGKCISRHRTQWAIRNLDIDMKIDLGVNIFIY